jgi:hypothetical protein
MSATRQEKLRFNTPALVFVRQFHPHLDGKEQVIPLNRVPLEKRTGELTVILALKGLVVNGAGEDGVYPKGAAIKYEQGCDVILEVFPRGHSDAEYARWQGNMLMDTVRLPNSRTPLFVSGDASPQARGAYRGGFDLEQVRVLDLSKLQPYLEGVLPWLGTHAADVEPTIKHVREALARGKKRVEALIQR